MVIRMVRYGDDAMVTGLKGWGNGAEKTGDPLQQAERTHLVLDDVLRLADVPAQALGVLGLLLVAGQSVVVEEGRGFWAGLQTDTQDVRPDIWGVWRPMVVVVMVMMMW